MRTKAIIVIIIILSSVSCSSSEEVSPIPPDFIGTWVAVQDEPLDTYEFFEDGTGLMRDSSESHTYYKPVPFVYKFVDENRIEFSAEEGHSIFVEIAMLSSKELSYDTDVSGGYHIDFEKVDECQYETLEECILGRWVRYWPNGEFTFYDFYRTGEGGAFVPEVEGTTHFSFQAIDTDSITYQIEDEEAIEVNVSLPDNYKMIFEFPNGEDEEITFYRLDAPFGP